jgi:AraC family transcriptional regulator
MPREGTAPEIVVEVIRGGCAVPLLPAASTLSSERIHWDGFRLNVFHDIPPWQVPEHEHPTHIASLVTSGCTNLHWTTGGRKRRAQYTPGDIYLLPAGTRDRLEWDQPTNRVILTVEPTVLARAFEETAHRADFEILERWVFKDRHIASLMLALSADLEDGSPAGRIYGESLGLAVAVYLARRYGVPTHEPRHFSGGLPRYRLRLVLDYIRTHLDQDVRLAELATLAGASPHYFAQLFRQSTGQSPHQYVLAQRIERAKRLLRNRTLSALDVAVLLGFADAGHFSKVFRRIVGSTPSRYRADL